MSKSTYAYVLHCVQSGTGQYSKVQGSTLNGKRQYKSKSNLNKVTVQGSHLEPLLSVYAWYIPCISQAYGNVTNMPGIYVVYPCIYMVYPMSWIYMVYPSLRSKDIPCISIEDIHGIMISLYLHGISEDVYTWYIRGISMYIPSFVCLDFWAGPCCWSQSMRTLVLVIKIGLFHALR